MNPRFALAWLVLVTAALARAQPPQPAYPPEKNWKAVCAQALKQPLEQPRLSTVPASANLANCGATSAYYGFTGTPDYPAALRCGWYQRAHPRPSVGNMFYGPGVLTMLYANGRGVPRNYDAAIHLACENIWQADAEGELRIDHLEYLKQTNPPTTTFDLCDDITSGLSMGSCTSIDTARQDVLRKLSLASTVSQLRRSAEPAYVKLRAADNTFIEARASHEVDLSGTARAMFELEEEASLRDQFASNLKALHARTLPPSSKEQTRALNRQMNQLYQRLLQIPMDSSIPGTVTTQGIRQTQRTWIKLRDAWLAFVPLAYPTVPVADLEAELLRQRLQQLNDLLTSQ